MLAAPSMRMEASTPSAVRAANTVVFGPRLRGASRPGPLAPGRPAIKGGEGQITATFVDEDQRFGTELRLGLGAPSRALYLIPFAGAEADFFCHSSQIPSARTSTKSRRSPQ